MTHYILRVHNPVNGESFRLDARDLKLDDEKLRKATYNIENSSFYLFQCTTE